MQETTPNTSPSHKGNWSSSSTPSSTTSSSSSSSSSGSSVSVVAVYPPSSKLGISTNQLNGIETVSAVPSPPQLKNLKRRRLSDEDLSTEQIKTQIFAYGKKPEIKLTLFPEMYSCSNCCEMFYTEIGLREHQQREVFSVLLNCPRCLIKKFFANRCQLLNHLKSHGMSPTVESLKGIITFLELPESKDFYDYSIVIPTRHSGYVPSAPTTIVPSQLDVAKTEIQKTSILLRGERQYKIIPVVNNALIKTNIVTLPITSTQQSTTALFPLTGIGINTPGSRTSSSLTTTPVRQGTKRLKSYYCVSCCCDFEDNLHFMEHIKKSIANTTEVVACSADGVPTRSQCERVIHTRVFHDNVPPLMCPDCGAEFNDVELLRCHDASMCFHMQKTLVYACNYEDKKDGISCNLKFTKINLLIKHMEDHFRDIFKCNLCPQALLSGELLQNHIDTIHKDESIHINSNQTGLSFVQCLLCNVIFFTRALFQEHFQSKLQDHCRTTIGFKCNTCPAVFEQKSDIGTHQPNCNWNHRARSGGMITKQNESNPRKCVYCKETFTTFRSLKRHQPNCVQKFSAQRKPEFCKICSKTLQGSKSFLAHGVTHLNAGMNICLLCNNRKLNDDEELSEHVMFVHVNPLRRLPHTCMFCEEKLLNKTDVHFHLLRHHEKTIKRFKCAICGKHFESVTDLTKHKADEHAISAPLAPPSFANGANPRTSPSGTSPSKNNKLSQHRPIFNYTFRCKICPDRKFQTRPGLRKHLRNHHRDVIFSESDWAEMRKITRTNTIVTTAQISNPVIPPKVKNLPSTSQNIELRRSPRDRRNSHTPSSTNRTSPPSLIGTHSGKVLENGGSDEDEVKMTALNARNEDGTIQCLKCMDNVPTDEATFTTEAAFVEHICLNHVWKDLEDESEVEPLDNSDTEDTTPHKIKPDLRFWCPECNLEFVAKASLRMHLISEHYQYVKNVTEYMDNIGYGKKERPLKENQCFVCRKRFANTFQYERHIRTHGMAFLKQRLQRSSV